MDTSYAPLLLRSNYSLLSGTSSIDNILQKAADLGFKSIALTDTNNLYGAIPFYKKAKELGIKPIIGTELIPEQESTCSKKQRLFLLARNIDGYSNICKIISRINGCGFRVQGSGSRNNSHSTIVNCKSSTFKFRQWIHILTEHQNGLYFLTEDTVVAEQLARYVTKKFIRLLIIRPDQNINTQRHIYSSALKIGVDVIGNGDIYLLEKSDYPFHKLLVAINEGRLVANDSENEQLSPTICNTKGHLRSPQEMEKLFKDCPNLLKNSVDIAEDCNVDIPMERYIFPKYHIAECDSPLGYLYKLCIKGLRWRYGTITKKIKDRLEYELDVINKLGFPEYFLVVGDIVRFARNQDIPVVGRGSGASSIVAYTLGITNVDPIRYNLCFERFMHLQRKDFPDLDIDICWRKRDNVINYVYNTYGADHVAMISTHNTFQSRSAFREAAKAYGISNNLVNKYSKFIPYHTDRPLSEIKNEISVFKELSENSASFEDIIKMTDRLSGQPRHLGIHSGGIVISDKPIDGYVPLEKATKGIVITQYDMRTIEDIGLIKIDLLGNRALSTIRETVNLIKQRGNTKIDLEKIPDKDPQTVKLLKNGDTLGCFQIESPGMRNLLKMLQVSSIDETIASLSLIRPGPATGGLKERYVRRARGLEKTTHIDSRLKDVLQDSYGIMLYEEDAIRSASAVAGISLTEGDEFRRAIAKAKTKDDLNNIAGKFIKQAKQNGVAPEIACSVGKHIANFARYTFCKAHAAGYGFLAYQGSYLKAHYPVEFVVGLLNNHQGMYEKRVHIEEARRMGIVILHPCVNRSGQEYTIEDGKIRVGLLQVKGLSTKAIEQITKKRSFLSLADFLNNVKISHKETESLIYSGAFDFTGKTRPELMWTLETTFCKTKFQDITFPTLTNLSSRKVSAKQLGHNTNFKRTSVRQTGYVTKPTLLDNYLRENISINNTPALNDYPPEKKFWKEYDVLEIFVNCHPMDIIKQRFEKKGLIDSHSLSSNTGKKAIISGILDAVRKTDTKRNERMMFLTLEDEKGMFEVTLFPAVFRKYGNILKNRGPYIIEGRVENQYGAITITADKISQWHYYF